MKGFLVVVFVLFAFGVCLVQAQAQPAGADTAKSYKLCPKCKVANSPDARFCFSCGTPFEEVTGIVAPPESALADSAHCPECGVERIPQAEFCSNCGVSFYTGHLAARIPLESGPKKEPLIAFASSLLIPGAGQLYNGQPVKGVLFIGCYLTGWYLIVQEMGHSLTGESGGGYGLPGLVIGSASWLISVIDAPASASDLNRRRGYSALTSPSVGFVLVPYPRDPKRARPGLGLRAGF